MREFSLSPQGRGMVDPIREISLSPQGRGWGRGR
jgi:hypothetical protein